MNRLISKEIINSNKEINKKVIYSNKEINRLRKDVNRLLNKGISNIYLKITIEKNWCSKNFDFLNLKNLSPVQVLGSSKWRRYHRILKLLKSKSPCILLIKNINFNKNKTGSKMKNPTLRESQTLFISSYKDYK